jgi:hypothetical protein
VNLTGLDLRCDSRQFSICPKNLRINGSQITGREADQIMVDFSQARSKLLVYGLLILFAAIFLILLMWGSAAYSGDPQVTVYVGVGTFALIIGIAGGYEIGTYVEWSHLREEAKKLQYEKALSTPEYIPPTTPKPELKNTGTDDPMTIIKARYARGEITKIQFEALKRDIE